VNCAGRLKGDVEAIWRVIATHEILSCILTRKLRA
jgi:hypothetical protein